MSHLLIPPQHHWVVIALDCWVASSAWSACWVVLRSNSTLSWHHTSTLRSRDRLIILKERAKWVQINRSSLVCLITRRSLSILQPYRLWHEYRSSIIIRKHGRRPSWLSLFHQLHIVLLFSDLRPYTLITTLRHPKYHIIILSCRSIIAHHSILRAFNCILSSESLGCIFLLIISWIIALYFLQLFLLVRIFFFFELL